MGATANFKCQSTQEKLTIKRVVARVEEIRYC